MALKGSDGSGCRFPVNSVLSNFWQVGISLGNPVKLTLELQYFLTGGTDRQVVTWPGDRNSRNFLGGIDIHVVAVEVA